MAEYLRRMPDGGEVFRRTTTVWSLLKLDPWLLGGLLVLAGFGLTVLNSAVDGSSAAIQRQSVYLMIGFFGMLVTAQIPVYRYARLAPWMYLVGMVALIAVLFIGVGAKGAQRWLSLSGFRFQPSEIMKLAVPLTVAWYLAKRSLPPNPKYVGATLILMGLPAVLIFLQPDLGTAILVAASGFFVLFLAGLSWRYILTAIAAVLALIWPLWSFVMKDYQRQRVLTLLDPESDRLGAGWNIIQSKTAIGSGGWSGKGYMQGTQTLLDFLPESHTDFIIAVLAEEYGLQGVLWLVLLYLFICLRGFWISYHAQSTYGRLVGASITLTFCVYVFVNMGMVAGILPVVGVPLPLVSAGGTSIVTLLAGFGILMAISQDKRQVN
ncbi:MAG: rod shape-determining protein RodA [Halieaceae bacterium]|nr:rod shape-determining protein RodA [Halieaceae bacterium]